MVNGQSSMVNELACLKAHIQTLDGVRQCANADEVNALLGIVADGIEGDAPTRLGLIAMGNDVDSLLGIGHAEVVEHDTVDAAMVEHLLQFVEIAHLNLNLQLQTLLVQILVATLDGIDDAASKVDVIVFEEYHVKKSYAMVAAATNLHGLLLQHTHSWCGLAGIEHTTSGALQPLHVFIGHSGDATHTLHDVEHESLGLQQGAHTTRDNHGDVALLDTSAVTHEHLDLHIWVEATEHLLGNLHTSQNAVFLDEQMRLTHRILGNTTQGSMVAVADVLGKRQVNQPVNQLLDMDVEIGSIEINV